MNLLKGIHLWTTSTVSQYTKQWSTIRSRLAVLLSDVVVVGLFVVVFFWGGFKHTLSLKFAWEGNTTVHISSQLTFVSLKYRQALVTACDYTQWQWPIDLPAFLTSPCDSLWLYTVAVTNRSACIFNGHAEVWEQKQCNLGLHLKSVKNSHVIPYSCTCNKWWVCGCVIRPCSQEPCKHSWGYSVLTCVDRNHVRIGGVCIWLRDTSGLTGNMWELMGICMWLSNTSALTGNMWELMRICMSLCNTFVLTGTM